MLVHDDMDTIEKDIQAIFSAEPKGFTINSK